MTSKSVLPESRSWPVPAGRITHVVRLELQCASLRAAKPDSGVPARNAEHFMNPEVAMRLFVNAIPPESSQPLRSKSSSNTAAGSNLPASRTGLR